MVIADPESGDHDKKAQWVVTVNKWPDDAGLQESMSWPTNRSKNQSTGHLEESSRDAGGITSPDVNHFSRSTGTRNRYGQVDTDNPTPIQFAQGKAEVSAADAAALQKFGATLGAPDMPPFPVTVTGRASSEGTADRNVRLSEDRALNVSNEIVKGGPQLQPTASPRAPTGPRRTRPGGAWRSSSARSRATSALSSTSSATCSGSTTSIRRRTQ